jgi:hypothetical protein
MRRQYAGGAKPTTLVSALGGSNSDLIVSGTDFTNYPDGSVGPFYIVIDRGQVNEEKILCSSRTGNTINVYNVGLTNGRGADGTSVVAHSPSATVEHVFTAVDADESNSHVNNTTSAHGLTIANVVTTTGTQTLTNKTISQSQITNLENDLASKANLSLTSNTKTVNYTLVLGDVGESIEMNVVSANTLTVPLNSSVAFPIGTTILLIQVGAGQTTITPAAGVTVNATPGLKLRAQWSVATLIKRGTNTWVVAGDVVA